MTAVLTLVLLRFALVHSSRCTQQVRFEIPYFTVSGIQVRYLKIIEKSGYQALPWVRYITQNGDYQLRMV
jgi:Adaptor complexes medium subunit family